MSQTVIFGVGIVIFALTVWGSVMAGGYWLGEIADAEDAEADPDPEAPLSPTES